MSARTYAKAVFERALAQDKVAEFRSELKDFCAKLERETERRAIFFNPWLGRKSKIEYFTQGVSKSGILPDLIRLLVGHKAEKLIFDIKRAFGVMADEYQGILRSTVESVLPLSAGSYARIEAILKDKYGQTVKVAPELNAAMLGGIRVRVGDKVFDGSWQGNLKKMARQLKG